MLGSLRRLQIPDALKGVGLASVAKWEEDVRCSGTASSYLFRARIESGKNVLFPPFSGVAENDPRLLCRILRRS